uniref:Ovule protein n=1 Tax=Steinernema glaseri TaxID=37863 RepID=A0A1I7YSB0_9BILA
MAIGYLSSRTLRVLIYMSQRRNEQLVFVPQNQGGLVSVGMNKRSSNRINLDTNEFTVVPTSKYLSSITMIMVFFYVVIPKRMEYRCTQQITWMVPKVYMLELRNNIDVLVFRLIHEVYPFIMT